MTTTRIFYDTEFLERGADHPLHLISIGMVTDDGSATLYAINADAPWHLIRDHPWLADNVLPHLPGAHGPHGWQPNYNHAAYLTRPALAGAVRRFILAQPSPRLRAWYSSHDHVALTGLFGPMANLPTGIPMRTGDIAQRHQDLGHPEIPPTPTMTAHHALDDARRARYIEHHLDSLEQAHKAEVGE